MSRLEVLCVTMHQKDFSKVAQMNIQSDVVFANQCDSTAYEEFAFGGYTARMISTETRGVGVNRNLSLLYARGEIVLLGDDDMRYADGYEAAVLNAFDALPDADVIIFNITSKGGRPQKQNTTVKKVGPLTKLPYGAPRIAIRLEALKRSNVWFTTLFGGGCRYTNGEDSVFLNQLRRAGLNIYVSPVLIGEVDMSQSTWFQGADEEFYFNKGAFLKAMHPVALLLYNVYFLFRVKSPLSLRARWRWLRAGSRAYSEGQTFSQVKERGT